MENEQAVVEETDVQAPPDTEESNAQDLELDNLLEEYSDTGETEQSQESTETQNDTESEKAETKQLISLLRQQTEKAAEEAASESFSKTIASVKGDMIVDDDFVEVFLDKEAKRDSRLRTAYLEREKKPAAWSRIEKGLREKMKKFINKNNIDKDATETREAVASSVLNSKSTSSESDAPDLTKMSDVEFENFKKGEFKKVGRGGF